MATKIQTLLKSHDWPLGQRMIENHIAIDLSGDESAWDQLFSTSSGSAAERLGALKFAAMNAFWHATISGETRSNTGKDWSRFADWCLNTALREAWNLPANRRFLKGGLPTEGAIPGLFIIGLGKLGGNDLNFSSDVDLIAFFDSATLPISENDGRGFVTARVLRDMGKILGSATGEPVWRVDWRLRPDSSVTDLSMSAEAGLSYYHFQSEPWRRLAMMKSRVVAGDLAAGARFMNDLKPFLWRKSLDFRMIDEIAELKSRIRNENPDIASHATASDDLDTADDYHFKLDRGGIREIEFIANALQLVWGGRQPQLRVTHTETALKELGRAKLLEPEQASRLTSAYHLFRGLENAVQGIANAQDYRVPKSKDERNLIAALAGYEDWNAVEKHIISERAFVHEAFQDLFKSAEVGAPQQPSTKLRLNKGSLQIVEEWRAGFVRCGVTGEMRATLRHLPDAILAALPLRSNCDEAIAALDGFFRQLPPGGQYLSLMAAQPQFLADIVEPIVIGGWAARLMGQTPHVADSLIERRGDLTSNIVPKLEDVAFLNSERDYEARLEAFRALVNERVFLTCLAFQRGLLGNAETSRALTGIAEIALAIGCRLVTDEYFKGRFTSESEMPIAILAMGKFGLAELTPGSDLDLVYIANEDIDLDTADRFARRLSTALGTKMRGGVVYEIDTRLRPSGNAGPPVLRLSTLEKHQMERANTWEHLALVPARLAFGGTEKAAAFESVKAKALARPRDPQQMARDAHKMLARLREHRIKSVTPGVLSIKLRPGGLMESEYLAAFLSLQFGRSVYHHPELMPEALRDALTLWRHLQLIARTLGVEDQMIANPQDIVSRLPVGLQMPDIFADMNTKANAVTALIDEHIVKPSGLKGKQLEAWEEGPVVNIGEIPN